MDRSLLLIPSLVVAGFLLRAQSAQQQTGSYSLDGTVVNGATGEPVSHALVRLTGQSQQMTMSGPDGRFEFQNLPGGHALAQAQKPGFYTRQEVEAGTPVGTLQIGRDSGIKLSLYPSGSISGRVTALSGGPVEGVRAITLYRQVVDGAARWARRNSATTDDQGNYRITNLIPGRYLVATETHPVSLLSPHVRRFGENFDDVYPGVYFPASAQASGATPVQVTPGQAAEANISETLARAYSVSGAIAGNTAGQVFLSLLDQDGNPTSIRIQRKGNRFKCLDVLPGEYTLSAAAPGGSSGMMYGQAPLSVNNADIEGVSLEIFPAAAIPVRTSYSTTADSALPPGEFYLVPTSLGVGTISRYQAYAPTQSTLAFENVMPGNYHVEFASSGSWYATGIRSGQNDLTRNNLTVTPGVEPEPVDITLSKGTAVLSGTVKGAEGLPQVAILAIPDGSAAAPRIYSSGPQFSLSGLAPGSYQIYAFTGTAGLEYRNPEVMKKYEDQSVTVNLSANETRQIDVPLTSGSNF